MITTHHKKVAYRLKKRGWDKHYIGKTVHLIKKTEKTKDPVVKYLDNILFWVALVIVIIGNVFILLGLLPLVFQLPESVIILIFGVIGISFGLLIDVALREMDHLSANHYIFAGFFIPLIVMIVFFGVFELGKIFAKEIGIFLQLNPLLVLIVYMLSFSLPILEYKVKEIK